MATHGRKLPKPLQRTWKKAARRLGLFLHANGSRCHLRGRVGHFDVRVSSPVRYSSYFPPVTDQLSFELTFPKPLPLHLSIRNEDGLTRFIRAIGFQDIALGDAVFDGRIYVKSTERARVVDFLTEPRRRAIVKLADGHDVVIITSKAIDVFMSESIKRPKQIVDTVEEMVELAKLLVKKTEAEKEKEREELGKGAKTKEDAAVPRASELESAPHDDEVEDIEVDLADAWLIGADTLPKWMAEQGIRLDEEE